MTYHAQEEDEMLPDGEGALHSKKRMQVVALIHQIRSGAEKTDNSAAIIQAVDALRLIVLPKFPDPLPTDTGGEDAMREILAQVHDNFGLVKTAVVIRTPGSEPSSIGFGACIAAMRRIRQTGSDFQDRVQPYMMACFGPEISADKIERNHRFLEEALELVQSIGCTADEAHQLVDYVFGRPVGEPSQEVGGVMVTLAALCLANNLNMHEAGETELTRIWTKVEAIRAKQAAKPKHSPLPQAATIPVPAHEEVQKPVCKSYHSRVLNGACQNCGNSYADHLTPPPAVEGDGLSISQIAFLASREMLPTPPAPAVESVRSSLPHISCEPGEGSHLVTLHWPLVGGGYALSFIPGPGDDTISFSWRESGHAYANAGIDYPMGTEAPAEIETIIRRLRSRSTRTAEVTEIFKNADVSDWDYIEAVLTNTMRHQHDAQTRFWIEGIKNLRAAIAAEEE